MFISMLVSHLNWTLFKSNTHSSKQACASKFRIDIFQIETSFFRIKLEALQDGQNNFLGTCREYLQHWVVGERQPIR